MGAYSGDAYLQKWFFRLGLIRRGGAYSSVGAYLRIYGMLEIRILIFVYIF